MKINTSEGNYETKGSQMTDILKSTKYGMKAQNFYLKKLKVMNNCF